MQELWNRIVGFVKDFPDFIERNSTNPLLWAALVLVLFFIGKTAINSFGDK